MTLSIVTGSQTKYLGLDTDALTLILLDSKSVDREKRRAERELDRDGKDSNVWDGRVYRTSREGERSKIERA
jgi:hypothetical protein